MKKPHERFSKVRIDDLSKVFYELELPLDEETEKKLRNFLFLCFWTGYHYRANNVAKNTVINELCEF